MELAFRLVVRGEGVSPETTSIGELAELLARLDRGLKALIADGQARESQVQLSLVAIESGSTALAFSANNVPVVSNAVNDVNAALVAQNVERLPKPTQELVSTVRGWAERKSASLALVPESKNYDQVPWISAGYPLPSQLALVYGETVLEGLLLRVGGKTPKIGLLTSDAGLLPCNTSEELARQAAPFLYRHVALEGLASWDPHNWSLVSFTAHRLLDYSPGPIGEALARLAELAGPDAWADWDDVSSTISALRKE